MTHSNSSEKSSQKSDSFSSNQKSSSSSSEDLSEDLSEKKEIHENCRHTLVDPLKLAEDHINLQNNQFRNGGPLQIWYHFKSWFLYKFSGPTFFLFPRNVSILTTRFTSFQVFLLCLIIIILRFIPSLSPTPFSFIMLGQTLDFLLRFFFGSNSSIQGSVANFFRIFFLKFYGPEKEKFFIPGAPKQFANFCGILFSGTATILFFAEDSGISGVVVTFFLLVASGLECFFNFCLGCKLFAFGVSIGIFPQEIVDDCNLWLKDMYLTYLQNNFRQYSKKSIEKVDISWKNSNQSVRYKRVFEEQKTEKWHPIKYIDSRYWNISLSLTAFAALFRFIETNGVFHVLEGKDGVAIWITLSIFSLFFLVIIAALHLFKAILFFHKLEKEWNHPILSNSIALIPLNGLLWAYIVESFSTDLTKVLFWISSPTLLFLEVISIARLIKEPIYIENFGAANMFPVVGNILSSFIATLLGEKYRELGWLYFSFSYLLYISFLSISLYRLFFYPFETDRIRPTLWTFVAAPSVAVFSYVSLNNQNGAIIFFDNFARFNYWVAVAWFFVLIALVLQKFFGRNLFDVDYWTYSFPLTALAFATFSYDLGLNTFTSHVLSIFAVSITTLVISILLINTLTAVINTRGLFNPNQKWSPISFMRIVHLAIRDSFEFSLNPLAKKIVKNPSAKKIEKFQKKFKDFAFIHHMHSFHEDEIQFRILDDWFPGSVTFHQEHEHIRDRKDVEEFVEFLESLSDEENFNSKEQTTVFSNTWKVVATHTLRHLENEEKDLNWVGRKFLPLKVLKQNVREIWQMNSAPEWSRFISWILKNVKLPSARVRFIKSLIWAMPERSQQIGSLIFDELNVVSKNENERNIWKEVAEQVPQIIPRNQNGWKRQY